jgi:hypothetical protein
MGIIFLFFSFLTTIGPVFLLATPQPDFLSDKGQNVFSPVNPSIKLQNVQGAYRQRFPLSLTSCPLKYRFILAQLVRRLSHKYYKSFTPTIRVVTCILQ